MKRRLSLLIALILLAGCSRLAPPEEAPVSAPQPGPPAAQPAPPAKKPETAQEWSDLSYAHLQAGRFEEALDAAKKGLELEVLHPHARYNAGIALLELGRPCESFPHLHQSSTAQPDRYEPYLALARANRDTLNYWAATYFLQKAIPLAGGAADALAMEKSIAAMRSTPEPADLRQKSVKQAEDGATTLYLYPQSVASCSGTVHTLFAARNGAPTLALPLGLAPVDMRQPVQKLDLGPGLAGYWLEGRETGAYVSGARARYLVLLSEKGLQAVTFRGAQGWDSGEVNPFVQATAPGKLTSDGLLATYRMSDANGKVEEHTLWRLDLKLASADKADHYQVARGRIAAIGDGLHIDVGYHTGPFQYPLADGVQFVKDGKPLPTNELRAGLYVTATIRDGKIVMVEL